MNVRNYSDNNKMQLLQIIDEEKGSLFVNFLLNAFQQ